MCLKSIVEQKVEENLAFLRKVVFDSQLIDKTDFITNMLLPYLFFTNTIDKNYRIIPIFLRKDEDIVHLPLFYALALFKLYSEDFLCSLNFSNRNFQVQEINLKDLDGEVSSIIRIDYLANNFVVKTGKGNIKFIDFDYVDIIGNINKCTGYYRKLEPIIFSVKEYLNSVRIGKNPLELIQNMASVNLNNYNNGALFFTHNPRFLKSSEFKDFTINQVPFLDTIPVSRVDYRLGEINLERLGNRRSKAGKEINKIKEFIAFTSLDYYNSYCEIKKAIGGLNTLIFDFTKNTKYFKNIIQTISTNYSSYLGSDGIKDIYMVFNEKDIPLFRDIDLDKVNFSPFLLSLDQKKELLDDSNLNEIELVDFDFVNFNDEFKHIDNILREFCRGVHISDLFSTVLSPFYQIKKRFNSFYDENDFRDKLKSFKDEILKIQRDWFYHSEWKMKIEFIYSFIDRLQEKLNNDKLFYLLDMQITKTSNICVVSYNENENDYEYLKSLTGLSEVDFLNPKSLKNVLNLFEKYQYVFVFNSSSDLSYICSLNLFRNKIYFFQNMIEKKIYKNIKENKLIAKLSGYSKLSEVLNINGKTDNIKRQEQVEEEVDLIGKEEFDLDLFVQGILRDNKGNQIYKSDLRLNSDIITLFFKDGSSISVSRSKYFFIHKDSLIILKDCHVKADDLNEGDIVFLLKYDNDVFETLIWKVAKHYPKIEEILKDDQQWRINIENYICQNEITKDDFSDHLKRFGYDIGGAAISTWISTDVYQPRKLEKLLTILSVLRIIPMDMKDRYLIAIKTAKKLKTKLPHELQKLYIADLNDLDYTSNYEFPELTKEMYKFMDIKTISLIIK